MGHTHEIQSNDSNGIDNKESPDSKESSNSSNSSNNSSSSTTSSSTTNPEPNDKKIQKKIKIKKTFNHIRKSGCGGGGGGRAELKEEDEWIESALLIVKTIKPKKISITKEEKREQKRMYKEEIRQKKVEHILMKRLGTLHKDTKALLGLHKGRSITVFRALSAEQKATAKAAAIAAANTAANTADELNGLAIDLTQDGVVVGGVVGGDVVEDGSNTTINHYLSKKRKGRNGRNERTTSSNIVDTRRTIRYCIRGGTSFKSDGALIEKRSIPASIRREREKLQLLHSKNSSNKNSATSFTSSSSNNSSRSSSNQHSGEEDQEQFMTQSSSSKNKSPYIISGTSPHRSLSSSSSSFSLSSATSSSFNGRLKSKWLLCDLKRLRLTDKHGNIRKGSKVERSACVSHALRTPLETASFNSSAYNRWVNGPKHLNEIKEALSFTKGQQSKEQTVELIRYLNVNDVYNDIDMMLSNASYFLNQCDSILIADKLIAMQHYLDAVKQAKPLTLNDVQNGVASFKKRRVR